MSAQNRSCHIITYCSKALRMWWLHFKYISGKMGKMTEKRTPCLTKLLHNRGLCWASRQSSCLSRNAFKSRTYGLQVVKTSPRAANIEKMMEGGQGMCWILRARQNMAVPVDRSRLPAQTRVWPDLLVQKATPLINPEPSSCRLRCCTVNHCFVPFCCFNIRLCSPWYLFCSWWCFWHSTLPFSPVYH